MWAAGSPWLLPFSPEGFGPGTCGGNHREGSKKEPTFPPHEARGTELHPECTLRSSWSESLGLSRQEGIFRIGKREAQRGCDGLNVTQQPV